ncbi:hypothetical protein FQA39_LY03489 [Lamprigera yunnana]|nr:hypothetical protein FQA39_LY03489 [Lamprigera yunnana]
MSSRISKYFKVENTEDESNSTVRQTSPYRNAISAIKVLNLNRSADDFKTPKIKEKLSKQKNVNVKKPTKKISQSKTQSKLTFGKNIDDIQSDCNLDHLQVAIALSKSLQSAKDNVTENEENNGTLLLKQLQQYQFLPKRDKSQPSKGFQYKPIEKKRGKPKVYLRSVLLLRTQEDRDKKISDKVSRILSNNISLKTINIKGNCEVFSKDLQKYYCQEQVIFRKSRYTKENELSDFYVASLKIDQSTAKCGSLLKNWHEIPGRSVSPSRNVKINEILEEKKMKNEDVKDYRCDSPDLFDSEGETSFTNTIVSSPKSNFIETNDFSFFNLIEYNRIENRKSGSITVDKKEDCKSISSTDINSFICENDKGICIFERFSDGEKEISIEDSAHHSLKTGITESFDKIISLSDDDTMDYIDNILNEESKKGRNCKEPIKFADELYTKEINLSCLTKTNISNQISIENVNDAVIDLSQSSGDDNLKSASTSCNSSTSEEIIHFSDAELNYSCTNSTPTVAQKKQRKTSYNLSHNDSNNSIELGNDKIDTSNSLDLNADIPKNINNTKAQLEDTILYSIKSNPSLNNLASTKANPVPSTNTSNPKTNADDNKKCYTPNRNIIIRSSSVTPMANYSEMSTPKIVKELDKYGLKPLKRHRGVQLLKHIYESTHPIVNKNVDHEADSDGCIKKKRKAHTFSDFSLQSSKKLIVDDNQDLHLNSKENDDFHNPKPIKITDNILGKNEPLIFERKQSRRVLSCMVPLHIAWHNLVASDQELEKKILLYEPLPLETLCTTLKSNGFRYHIQDVINFLDRKCVTIRIEKERKHNKRY